MKNLGKKMRQIRLEQHRTLEDVAENCGFTKSFLSKVENGKTVPAVASLVKISEALGVKMSVLVDDDENANGTILTKKDEMDLANMIRTNKGYLFHPIAAKRRDKMMQPFLFVAKYGEVKTHSLTHEGEEFIYILDGTMKYTISDEEYILHPGDSLYFDSHETHKLSPLTDEVYYLAVFVK